ncbi:MAG TPA: hypothetical protein VN578_16800 [Candidatus Binatia bacterium]|jgi:hypothetical protein|nr:hypothetical protein [Candidatus Binatia bacterium]
MNLTRLKMPLYATFLAATTLSSLASPMNRADVAADPAWLAHLDCDRLRATAIGQYLQTEMEKPEAQKKLSGFQAMVGFDLRTQLHGLTLYSTGGAPEDGVLLVYADFDPDRLVTLAQAAQDSQSTNYKKHVIYNWIDDKKKPQNGVQPRVYAAIQGKRIVFAQRENRVAEALEVLDGTTSSLAAGDTFSPLGAAGDTSFIEAAARKTDLLAADPKAAILRLSKVVRLQIAVSQAKVNAKLTLEANDDEVASQITTIGQGLVALMKLQKEKPEALKIAEGLTLKQQGASVQASLSLQANEVVDMMKADAARKAQKQVK